MYWTSPIRFIRWWDFSTLYFFKIQKPRRTHLRDKVTTKDKKTQWEKRVTIETLFLVRYDWREKKKQNPGVKKALQNGASHNTSCRRCGSLLATNKKSSEQWRYGTTGRVDVKDSETGSESKMCDWDCFSFPFPVLDGLSFFFGIHRWTRRWNAESSWRYLSRRLSICLTFLSCICV